jgi:HK97 family phage major capsid protein
LHLRDIVATYGFPTGSILYPRGAIPVGQGSFSRPGEGNAKNQIDYSLQVISLSLKYLAAYCKTSRELLQDLPWAMQYISSSLAEDFMQAEDTDYFNKLPALSTAGVTSASATAEKICDYAAQVENFGYVPNTILVNPTTWATILKTLPSGGSYSVPGGWKILDNGQVLFAGIPLFRSPLVPSTKLFVGDFTKLGIAQTDQFNIRSTEYNASDFQTNLITFRAEARADLMVFATQAIVYGNS